jgi:hypothetical protein
MRAASAPGPRSLAVRRRQWRDFAGFALRSGPKLARFWYEAGTPASRPAPAATEGCHHGQ